MRRLALFIFCVVFVGISFYAIIGAVSFHKERQKTYLWKEVQKIDNKYFYEGSRVKVKI